MFITNYPAMKIRDWLVIADLHMGLEHEIFKGGIRVSQIDDIISRTTELIRITGARNLLLLGDVKHNVPYLKRAEEVSVPLFLSEVGKKVNIVIVPGNHDGSLSKLCPPEVDIRESSGIMIGKYGLLHGHAKPSKDMKKAETIIIGHNHPIIRIVDRGGARYFRQVWIRGKTKDGKNLIVMPAFSRLVGGMIINDLASSRDMLGPVAKSLDLKNSSLFLLDGTCIGKFGEIMHEGRVVSD